MRIHWAQKGNVIGSYLTQIPEHLEDWDFVMWVEKYDWSYGAVINRYEYRGSESIYKLPKMWTWG